MGGNIGIACNHKSCPSGTFTGADAFNQWLRHSEETGHTDHRWTNALSEKGKSEFNAPYSHPSGRF